MEKNHITFTPDVLLLDVTFLNDTVYNAKRLLAERLRRALPDTDLVAWLLCLALDGGLRGEGRVVQILLVADEGVHALQGCAPGLLEELDGKACRTPLGEFSFSVVPSAGMVTRADLFCELAKLALDAQEVEHLLLVPYFYEYGEKLRKTFRDFTLEAEDEKALGKALCFLLEEPDGGLPCRADLVTYSLMHVWGIAPEDL